MELLTLICDPLSKEVLKHEDGILSSSDRTYPVINGVPVMLLDKTSQDREAEKLQSKKYKLGFSWALSHWDDLKIHSLLGQAIPEKNMLLNFGSGSPQEKQKMIEQGYRVVSIDINAGYAGVDIIGDGHCLPLFDKTFNVVSAFEVLEHLHEPWTAIKEINRVLENGGTFVGSVAFLKQFHHSYFHMSYWGVKKLIEYGGFELEVIYGGQNIFSRLVSMILPLGPSKFSKSVYDILNNSLMYFRKKYWSIKRKTPYTEKMDKFDKNVKFSFEEYDKIIYAPTVLFRARKVRDV